MPNLNSFTSDYYSFIGKDFTNEVATRLKQNALLRIVGQVDTNSIDYELTEMGGFPELPEYTGEIATINPARGFKAVIAPSERAGSYLIHYKDWKNDKKGEIKRCAKHLGQSAADTIYFATLDAFGGAFTLTGADGKAWAASDHPNAAKYEVGRGYVADAEKGTTSNLIQSSAGAYLTLTKTNLETAMVQASKFTTASGSPLLARHSLLLVSPDLAPKARAILGGDAEIGGLFAVGGKTPDRDPSSAENAASSVAGMKWMVVGCGSGANARGLKGNQWALCDPDMLKETLIVVFNERPKLLMDKPNPLIDRYTEYTAFKVGYNGFRSILFSNPA
jgi:hypothetical protein